MSKTGIEPSANSCGNDGRLAEVCAELSTLAAEVGVDDARLARLIDAWARLSEETREAIASLVDDDSHDVDDVTVASGGEAGA